MSRIERSVVVGARVDVVELAKWVRFLERRGVKVKSASGAVGMALGSIVGVIEGEVGEMGELGVGDAWEVLLERGLVQNTMAKKDRKRVIVSSVLDSIRRDGGDPRIEYPLGYKMVRSNRIGREVVEEIEEGISAVINGRDRGEVRELARKLAEDEERRRTDDMFERARIKEMVEKVREELE